ncbi:MAG: preprotein translocase subunit SecE [Candidatus Obscuribacterales bacterium]|nr:preprotein translocase subunit SecE [Candidatus Obscuribacterales bacterium]
MATNQGDSGTGDSTVQSAPNKPKLVVADAKGSKGSKDSGGSKPMPADKDKKGLSEQIKTFQQYLKDVVVEFKKISWPDRAEIGRATLSVLVLVAIITLLVLGFDFILGRAIFGPLDHWVRLHGGLVGR